MQLWRTAQKCAGSRLWQLQSACARGRLQAPAAPGRQPAADGARAGPHAVLATGSARQQHVGGGGFGGGGGWRQKCSDSWRQTMVLGGLGCAFAFPFALERIQCKERWTFSTLESLDQRFVKKAVLGEGGQAVVYRALDKVTGKMVAIKVTKKDHPDGQKLVLAELELMTGIGSHPNLTSLQGAFETDDSWILVMDLADGGALFERIIDQGVLSEALASDFILQVAEGLMHMHRRGLAHGDIKPENLLLCSASSDENASMCVNECAAKRSHRTLSVGLPTRSASDLRSGPFRCLPDAAWLPLLACSKICDFGMARPTSKHGFAFSYTCGMHATCHTQHASMPHV